MDAFHLWHQQAERQIQHQRQLLIAEHFWSLSLLSTCFMYWQLGMRSVQRKKHLQRLALGFWAHKRLSISWLAFKKAVDLRHTILTMTKNRNQQFLASLFKHWHCVTIEALKELQEQAFCACNKSLLVKSFRTLQDYVARKRSYKHINSIALCFHHDQCMCCTYKAWHDYVVLRHDKRRLAAAALMHLRRKLMRSVFNRWHTYTQFKKRQDSINTVYEEKLCSRCIQIWKDHVLSKTQICNCSDIPENQALSRLSLVVTLLQSQNRLLRQGFHVMARRGRRFSQRRQIKTFIISRAHSFYKRCIREMKCAAQKYLQKSKEKRCHVCTEHVLWNTQSIARARLPVVQDSTCGVAAGTKETLCKSEGRSLLAPSTDSIVLPSISAFPDSSIVQRTPFEGLPRMQETRSLLGNSRGRFSRKTRLPPRRPSYLSDAFALEGHLSDPKLIREELIWTEDLLCSFDKLKEELREKETELSVLREWHDSGDSASGAKCRAEKIKFLEEKIMFLQERQSILLPMVESLASRAGALQKSFCKGKQVLHLD